MINLILCTSKAKLIKLFFLTKKLVLDCAALKLYLTCVTKLNHANSDKMPKSLAYTVSFHCNEVYLLDLNQSKSELVDMAINVRQTHRAANKRHFARIRSDLW